MLAESRNDSLESFSLNILADNIIMTSAKIQEVNEVDESDLEILDEAIKLIDSARNGKNIIRNNLFFQEDATTAVNDFLRIIKIESIYSISNFDESLHEIKSALERVLRKELNTEDLVKIRFFFHKLRKTTYSNMAYQ